MGEGSMADHGLTEAVCHSGGVVRGSTVTRTCRATGETVLVPPEKSAEPGRSYNRETGKSAEDETVAAGLAVAMKRGNARGAKEPCCTDVGINGRQGWLDKPTQYAARPETTTVRYGEGCDSVGTVE